MPEKSIVQKLLIKPGKRLLVIHPPDNYSKVLDPLPEGVIQIREPSREVDIIQLFVENRKELEEWLPRLKGFLLPDGILWITYYKGTSQHKTDINRDLINAYAHTLDLQGVAMISIDDDWSALRLKPIRS